MYDGGMRTITITIPEDLDQRAAAEARRRGISKSELIRQGLQTVVPEIAEPAQSDPWRTLSGFGATDVSVGPGEIDEVVYGR